MPGSALAPDELLTLPEVAAALPRRRNGAKTAISTLWRWSTRGSRGVFLRVTRIGGNVYISRADLLDFIERRSSPPKAQAFPSPSAAATSAAHRLEKQGL